MESGVKMNSSANLISLSDSGAGPNLSTSLMNSSGRDGDFHGRGPGISNRAGITGNEMENTGTEMLIDFSDEVQVPVSQGILLQAEVDDTFGIFSRVQQQQSSQVSKKGEEKIKEKGGKSRKNEGANLLGSFTSGRKSDGVKTKMKSDEEVTSNEIEEEDKKDAVSPNDSCESVASDQVTIVESDDEDSPGDENEKGIMDEKINLTTSSNFSGGSDSEILDVNNLSSFSIPDDELDANEFIEDIKQKDMASSSVTAAIVNQIKMEMLQEEEKEQPVTRKSSIKQHCPISDISRQSLKTSTSISTTVTSARSRLSSVSVTSTTSASSHGSSQANNSVLEDDTIHVAPPTTTRGRLSSGNFGSPIRASYPLSNRYFMPTPNAKAPSAAASISRQDYQRDKLTDSLFSPSRTRVMLITGDSHRSPSRVPVRKSISAETLHYEHSTPARNFHRQSVKFSTPSNRSRHSINIHQDIPRFPNIFGDDLPGMHDHQPQPHNVTITDGVDYMPYRRGRQSYASSASSNTSLNTLSPPSYYSRDLNLSHAANQINRLNLDETTTTRTSITAKVHPIRATAVIAPTNLSKPILKPAPTLSGTSSTRSDLLMPPKPKPAGQQSNHRPIASSSPKIAPSPGRPAANQTTPSRVRTGINVRSSGYGAQQNLTSTFGANQPLKSPNRATSANIKPAAIPKSLKTGVPSLGGKLELATKGGGTTTSRSGVAALKPTGKLPVPGYTTGIRRPGIATNTLPSAGNVGNKENKLRPLSTAASTRVGLRQAYHRQ